MKYKLCWWEENGYHDSYFYGVYYDGDKHELESVGLGATAYGGGIGFDNSYALPTPEILELARQLLAERIFVQIKAAEEMDIYRPGPASVKLGRKFELLEPHSYFARIPTTCDRCDGSGLWVNPKNIQDLRKCFSCDGLGHSKKLGYVKDETGKRVKKTLPKGTTIESTRDEVVFFGTVYKNGYNRPHRFNTSVETKLSGYRVRVPLEKLRQAKPPMSDAELKERAEKLSHDHQYAPLFGCKSWCCDNWAAALATTQR